MEEPKYHLPGVVHTRTDLNEDFEGPLDVIFLLLSKNKIEIQDVSISSILEQYLAYLEERKRMDMEIASEFIAMASHLMQIKTKMLLSVTEREEAMSEMEQLIRSLAERQRAGAYEQIQIAAKFLEQRNEIGVNLFVKQPEAYQVDHTYRYRHDKSDLVRALAMIAERSERQLPPPVSNFAGIVGAEPYPVTKKAQELLKRRCCCGAMPGSGRCSGATGAAAKLWRHFWPFWSSAVSNPCGCESPSRSQMMWKLCLKRCPKRRFERRPMRGTGGIGTGRGGHLVCSWRECAAAASGNGHGE